MPRSPSPVTSTAFDRQVVRLHRLFSAIGICVLDVAQRNSAKGDGPASGWRRVLPRARTYRDRVTALVEEIWCEKIRGCSDRDGNMVLINRDCGASYSMYAMPAWRPKSAAQRNDAVGHQRTSHRRIPALRARQIKLEDTSVVGNRRSRTGETQGAPKSGLVCSQNRTAQTFLQRIDHPNGAKAVATNEDGFSFVGHVRTYPVVELVWLNSLLIRWQICRCPWLWK